MTLNLFRFGSRKKSSGSKKRKKRKKSSSSSVGKKKAHHAPKRKKSVSHGHTFPAIVTKKGRKLHITLNV